MIVEELKHVCPLIESEQPIQPKDHSEIVAVKRSRDHNVQTVFADMVSLT